MKLDGPIVKEIRKQTSFNPTDLSALDQLDNDWVLALDVLWVLCRVQAKAFAPPVTEIQFGESLVDDKLNGDLAKNATDALIETCIDFCPRSDRRAAVRLGRAKAAEAQKVAIEMASETLNDPATMEEMRAELKKVLTTRKFAMNSPES